MPPLASLKPLALRSERTSKFPQRLARACARNVPRPKPWPHRSRQDHGDKASYRKSPSCATITCWLGFKRRRRSTWDRCRPLYTRVEVGLLKLPPQPVDAAKALKKSLDPVG